MKGMKVLGKLFFVLVLLWLGFSNEAVLLVRGWDSNLPKWTPQQYCPCFPFFLLRTTTQCHRCCRAYQSANNIKNTIVQWAYASVDWTRVLKKVRPFGRGRVAQSACCGAWLEVWKFTPSSLRRLGERGSALLQRRHGCLVLLTYKGFLLPSR